MMKHVRHHQHHSMVYIIIGSLSSAIGLLLLAFIIYMLPFILFDLDYTVPQFVRNFSDWLMNSREIAGFWHMVALLLPFVVASGVFFLIAWYTTRLVEQRERHIAEYLQSHKDAKYIDVQEANLDPNAVPTNFIERHPAFFLTIIVAIILVIFVFI